MNEKKKKKILVVDDEITVCKSIRQAILLDDYEVDTALSGEEALKKDDDKNYDLIVTDLMMPGITGIDLLKSLRKKRPEANVIMITGYPTIKTAVESIKIGAFDYIPKPFTPSELRSLVFRSFKKSEGKGEEALPEIKMPPGLHFMIGHTWLRTKENNIASVGVVFDFLQTVEKIIYLELPKINDSLNQGELCAKIIDDRKFTHRIWSPASGRVVDINNILGKDYSLLKKDPYHKGWLFKLDLINWEEDRKGLLLSK
jgi:CheY-like chemotaxis protein